jgi:hypothetical protein
MQIVIERCALGHQQRPLASFRKNRDARRVLVTCNHTLECDANRQGLRNPRIRRKGIHRRRYLQPPGLFCNPQACNRNDSQCQEDARQAAEIESIHSGDPQPNVVDKTYRNTADHQSADVFAVIYVFNIFYNYAWRQLGASTSPEGWAEWTTWQLIN